MTTATSTFSYSNTDLTAQKVWLNGVKDLIVAAGLTQTTDTGQLDIAAMGSLISNTNTTIGYLVFKFPDTLQATAPIYIRVDFKNNSSGLPGVFTTVSAATDGAGTLSTPSHITTLATASTFQSSLGSYACYTDGTFTMLLGYAAVSGSALDNCLASLVVDRARSSTGVALGTGFLCEAVSPQNGSTQSRSIFGGASPATSNFTPALIPSQNATSSSDGANVNVFRHYMMVPGVKPSLGALSYFSAEFGALSPFTATVLGSSHTYLPMGVAMNAYSVRNDANHCGAIRWE